MKRILLVFIFAFFYSCGCDEETYYLSEDKIALFPYENTSSVTFIDNSENSVVFEDIRYERDVYEENNPTGFIAFGPKCDDSYEEIYVSMSSGNNYEFYIGTRSGFKTTIVDNTLGYFYLEKNEYINDYSFDGVTYNDVLRVYSEYHDSEVIFISNIGVVSIQYGYQELVPELWQSLILLN